MNTNELQPWVDQLLHDGMVKWQDTDKSRLYVTVERKFLLRAGGYVLLVLSHDYQRKLRRQTRLDSIRANLQFFYNNPAYTRWRRPIQLADTALEKDWFNEKNIIRLTAVAILVFITLLTVLMVR
jgi:hypothetical protein